ncbi:MAG TPA: DNA repair protein RecN [Bacteroidales bacterium]|nr:DNA repair protein RecN [Bacteroidales bacterium]
MLLSLQIENYAIIKSLSIDFDKGFTVVTGETGAGKSILVGALGLILGQRAESAIFHDKSKKCFVEAQFDIKNIDLASFFKKYNLDYQENTFIRRETLPNGKSRAFVNDSPVTLQILKELTEKLIDIHSQHHYLLLQQHPFRLKVIDDFLGDNRFLGEYKKEYSEFKDIEDKYHSLQKKLNSERQEVSYWEYVINELENANLQPNEQEELENKIEFLSNATLIKTNLHEATAIMSENEVNVLEMLQKVARNCQQISSYNANIQNLESRLSSVITELKDISYELANLEDAVEVNPELIDRLRERLDIIFTFQQKHRLSSVQELLQLQEKMKEKVNRFLEEEEQLQEFEKELVSAKERVAKSAKLLSEQRKKVLPSLEKAILDKLLLLGMQKTTFNILLNETASFGELGIDEAVFLFSANPGSPAVEIEKVASGGEISRVMLAIKSVISESAFLPTVVFDEIDTGISGDTASRVGNLMRQIGTQRQLIVITHLPQIAAKGELHYYVYKEVEEKHTFTSIKKIEDKERIYEIAKMMSGKNVSAAALEAAQELIESRNVINFF